MIGHTSIEVSIVGIFSPVFDGRAGIVDIDEDERTVIFDIRWGWWLAWFDPHAGAMVCLGAGSVSLRCMLGKAAIGRAPSSVSDTVGIAAVGRFAESHVLPLL